jgi:hypothetical protein
MSSIRVRGRWGVRNLLPELNAKCSNRFTKVHLDSSQQNCPAANLLHFPWTQTLLMLPIWCRSVIRKVFSRLMPTQWPFPSTRRLGARSKCITALFSNVKLTNEQTGNTVESIVNAMRAIVYPFTLLCETCTFFVAEASNLLIEICSCHPI